jgi:hypothetical protein
MVGQILPNNNESATGIFPQKFCHLNTPLERERGICVVWGLKMKNIGFALVKMEWFLSESGTPSARMFGWDVASRRGSDTCAAPAPHPAPAPVLVSVAGTTPTPRPAGETHVS